MTLRQAMTSREGQREVDFQIGRGLRAWAIERVTHNANRDYRETTIVFGKSRSDALRRASAPARLGEECAHQETVAAEIVSDWHSEIVWPLERVS